MLKNSQIMTEVKLYISYVRIDPEADWVLDLKRSVDLCELQRLWFQDCKELSRRFDQV